MTKIITPPKGMELDPRTEIPDISKTKRETITWVIGIIDSNGALDYRVLKLGDHSSHETFWPTITHKRWRYSIIDGEITSLRNDYKPDTEEWALISTKIHKLGLLRTWTRFYLIISGVLPYPENSIWRKVTKVYEARGANDSKKVHKKRAA